MPQRCVYSMDSFHTTSSIVADFELKLRRQIKLNLHVVCIASYTRPLFGAIITIMVLFWKAFFADSRTPGAIHDTSKTPDFFAVILVHSACLMYLQNSVLKIMFMFSNALACLQCLLVLSCCARQLSHIHCIYYLLCIVYHSLLQDPQKHM